MPIIIKDKILDDTDEIIRALGELRPFESFAEENKADAIQCYRNEAEEKQKLADAALFISDISGNSQKFNDKITNEGFEEAIGNYEHSIKMFLSAKDYYQAEQACNKLIKAINARGPLEIFEYIKKSQLNLYSDNPKLENTLIVATILREKGEYKRSNKYFSKAYLLQQGEIDNDAVWVGQHEVGFSADEKIGTDNIQQCVVVIMRDPESKKTMLAHVDRYVDATSLKEIIKDNFDTDLDLECWIVGGRDRSEYGKEVSDDNIRKTIGELQTELKINIKDGSIADTPTPSAITFDPESGILEHKVPKLDPVQGLRIAYFIANFMYPDGVDPKSLYHVFDLTKNADTKNQSRKTF